VYSTTQNVLVGAEHFVGDLAEEHLLVGPQAGRRRLSLEGLSEEQRHLSGLEEQQEDQEEGEQQEQEEEQEEEQEGDQEEDTEQGCGLDSVRLPLLETRRQHAAMWHPAAITPSSHSNYDDNNNVYGLVELPRDERRLRVRLTG